MPHSFAIALIRSEKIRGFYEYWAAKRNGRGMPSHADLDPGEIKPLLPSIIVGEIRHAPFRIFYRLVGTDVAHRWGRDFTGAYHHDLDLETDEDWAECYRLVCVRKRSLFGRFTLSRGDGLIVPAEYGLFPFSEDGAVVNQCVTIVAYDSPAKRAA